MASATQIQMYVFLGLGCLFFTLSTYVRLTGEQNHNMAAEKVESVTKWLMILSGLCIGVSTGTTIAKKDSIQKRDIFETIIVFSAILASWVAAFKDCGLPVLGLTTGIAILGNISLDS